MRFSFSILLAGIYLSLFLCASLALGQTRREPVLLVPANDHVLGPLAMAAVGQQRPVLLFDPRDSGLVERYAKESGRRVECLARSETPPEIAALMEQVAGVPCETSDDPLGLVAKLWPKTNTAIVVDAGNDSWLLHAAAFGGATGSAVMPLDPADPLPSETFKKLQIETLYLTPPFHSRAGATSNVVAQKVEINSPDDLTRELLRRLPTAPSTFVIANHTDQEGIFSPSSLSLLAPLVSAAHKAPLFLTKRRKADAVETGAEQFLDRNDLNPTHVILVGDELALRSHQVPDPVFATGGPEARGGGTVIRVELFSRIHQGAPQDLAVGRIVAGNAAIGSVLLARQLHEPERKAKKPVVFLANADSIFQLGETISRTTVQDLRNVGNRVAAYYREEVTRERIQQSLGDAGVLVWEGHPRDLTLEESGGAEVKTVPDYVILQGCYTFDRSDPFILIEKGTRALVATSAAIYSAPGSAFARALFDSLLYDQVDLGTAVRNARNYLLALARLQEARGHTQWQKTLRAALAFALWGDPTVQVPLRRAHPTRTPVRWNREQDKLILSIPKRAVGEASVARYIARPAPRAMLGGLLLVEGERRLLKELYFTVQQTSDSTVGACAPTRGWDVVSFSAPRSGSFFLLARPDWIELGRSKQHGEFSFPLVTDSQTCAPTPTIAKPENP